MARAKEFDPVSALLELTGRAPRVAVAFSGGMDSTVLAHVLMKRRRLLASLRLIHIDHGLQRASARWSRHCAHQARAWGVPFKAMRAKVRRASGESPEAAARAARYESLANELAAGEVLVTAQHRDDQVETLLLQLFRGAGVAGLAAMPAIAPFGRGSIARPLLVFSRAQIAAYAMGHRLAYVDDPSNDDTRFARNFLRHHVLPAIREKWVGVDEAIARSARHMAEARGLLDSFATTALAAAMDGDALAATRLRALTSARRRNALRAFIAQASITLPSTSKLDEIAGPLLEARGDAQPEVRWEGAAIRRRANRLELHVISHDRGGARFGIHPKTWRWRTERTCIVNDAGDRLELVDDEHGPIDLERLPAALAVRGRHGGEELRPSPRARTQSLKKLLQSTNVDLASRARLPLLFSGKVLLAAGDRFIDASIAANVKSRRRARLRWTMTT